jgi:hypothetical protein
MRLLQTYRGPEAQRFALEPPPYGADWPEVAYEAEVIFVHGSEPDEPGPHFYLLLAYDAEGRATMTWHPGVEHLRLGLD